MMHKILFSSLTGSHLHGTNTPQSDMDARVVYRDSLADRISPLDRGTTTRTDRYTDTTYFELTHFAHMLRKCNPTCIEVLWGIQAEGDLALMGMLRLVSMDTVLYAKQCNGMILGMLNRATPKRLHHAARIHTHLTNYLEHGIIEFNAAKYDNYLYLCALKRGEVEFDPKYAEKVEVRKVWDEQNLAGLEDIVISQYKEDIYEL